MEFIAEIPVIGTILLPVVAFLIVLSVIVFVHEYGHYIVGRWCGIRAEVFSIGFGKVLWRWIDRHGTQWQVAALPLGGFVKFVGDMDPASAGKVKEGLSREAQAEAFHLAPLWARTLTVLAGPVANFLLTIALLSASTMIDGKSSDKPVIGEVVANAPDIGFETGDEVREIDGSPVTNFGEIIGLLLRTDGAEVPALVRRGGELQEIMVSYRFGARIGNVQAGRPAVQAGLLPGDLITALNGTPVASFHELRVVTSELPIGHEISVTVEREGEEMTVTFMPATVERAHPVTGEVVPQVTLGISAADDLGLRPTSVGVGPVEAIWLGTRNTWNLIHRTGTFMSDMVFTKADTSGLGGPIRIAQLSGETAKAGIGSLFLWIALLSTSIGLLNLLPIPVLDGGHLMFYAVEAVRGRPLGERWMRYGTAIGLSLVLFLMVFATYNDLVRL